MIDFASNQEGPERASVMEEEKPCDCGSEGGLVC